MNTTELTDLSDALTAFKQNGDKKAFHFRMLAEAADGAVFLVVQKNDSGLDALMTNMRNAAKDKRLASGRLILQQSGTWVFGVDEGNLKDEPATKLIQKDLAKVITKHAASLKKAKVLSGDPWATIAPTEDAPAGRQLGADKLNIDTRETASATGAGRKSSNSSDKKGSDYSMFLEALASWHHRFGNGTSFTDSNYMGALQLLDDIENRADRWLADHKKKFFETSKTKERRDEVQRVRTQVQSGRDKLKAFHAFATVRTQWETEIGANVTAATYRRARQLVLDLDRAAHELVTAAGRTPRTNSAVDFRNDAEQAADNLHGNTGLALGTAVQAWFDKYPRGVGPDDLAGVGPLQNQLRAALDDMALVSDSLRPPQIRGEAMLKDLDVTRAAKTLTDELAKQLETYHSDMPKVPTSANVYEATQTAAVLARAVRELSELLALRPAPKVLLDARQALLTFEQTSGDAWGPTLKKLQDTVKKAEVWKDEVPRSDLSKARALVDQLAAQVENLTTGKVNHSDVERGAKVVAHLRQLILEAEATHDVTEKEREAFRKSAKLSEEERRKTHEVELGKWSEGVNEGLKEGRYAKGKELASGTYGTVSLMTGGKDDPPVVVKEDLNGANEVEVEARVYEQLGAHPNIAPVYGTIELNGKKALVMKQITGGNGDQAIVKGRKAVTEGALTSLEYWGAVQHMIRGTVRGLVHMASKGLGHNDMKNLNVMIDADTGETVLVDMGSARKQGDDIGAGTAGFIPMEEDKTTEKRDMFAVGGMAYTVGSEVSAPNYGHAKMHYFAAWNRMTANGPDLSDPKFAKLSGAYKQFVRDVYTSDPEGRLGFDGALEHPFLADPILPEPEARKALQKLAAMK